jgi:hypothetical protein
MPEKRSQNGKFKVAWQGSLNPLTDKNKQVCLIKNGKSVLWCEEFEIIDTCLVSNNGTVVVLVHNSLPARDIHNRPGFLNKDSLIIINKDQDKFQLEFDTREEIMAVALSQNGAYLIYNLQRYRPDDYQLVLYDVNSNKEEWRYKYSRKQVIHELVFKDDHVVVYAGPRPSAYVERRYSFTLDLNGRTTSNDPEEVRKQEERDHFSTRLGNLAGEAGRILKETLANIVPTIEVERSLYGTRTLSRGSQDIMIGRLSLPALIIIVNPVLYGPFAEPDYAKLKKQGWRFFLDIEVVAKSVEERDEVSKDCVQMLTQQEGNLREEGLVFEIRLNSDVIRHYPSSESYFRTRISGILIFPAKHSIQARILQEKSWREVVDLLSDESIIVVNDVTLSTQLGKFDGKLVLTTKRLIILIRNPISRQFKIIELPPEKAQDVIIGGKEEKYIVRERGSEEERKHARIYFKPGQKDSFKTFRKEFELFRKRGHL